ncbi:MAG TPA: SPOR domain-containing protein [Vicinamibacterales bacterium]|nr:SPOR domain-containing protein [Vicinamibacterales bacterium]
MSDQGVREIQLNGKQLVFMFMTATVAAVVIFLCGVMVGRGVNSTRVSAAAAAVAAEPTVDPTATPETPTTTSSDATSSGEPLSAQEDLKDLTYAKRLEAPEPPPEPAIESVRAPAPAITETKVERPAPPPSAASKAAAPAASKTVTTGDPKGSGFVVQVASLRSREEADAIARRLSSKGYASFVTTPGANGPRVFRVRVGKFTERSEAETVARRLEKEEQFKPWITR